MSVRDDVPPSPAAAGPGSAPPALPADADALLALAARSMFDVFARTAMGMLVVDREHRVVWISEGYKSFLPGLGFAHEAEFVGRRVEEVVPNTMMAQVIDSGRPIMVDLLSNRAGTFLVSRLPLRDAAGQVIGAIGLVLMDHPETTMQPLMAKFARLQAELESARRRLAEQRRPRHTIAGFIGASPAALDVKRQARRVAPTDATVLLLGETGTGKELLAQALHAESPRAGRPFVGVNIAAVPETLLEAEFFGVAPGAYTGADRKGRDGKFKLADGGTLFLDEIGDMPLALQARLLRVLSEREVLPVGATRAVPVNIRVIAATHAPLEALVREGRFRDDLYYRLNGALVQLPPLRERTDLSAMIDRMLGGRTLTPQARAHLLAHRWPGNLRELRNALDFATSVCPQGPIGLDDLPDLEPAPAMSTPGAGITDTPGTRAGAGLTRSTSATAPWSEPGIPADAALHEALRAAQWNVSAVARALGLSRMTLYRRMKRAAIVPPNRQ